MNNQDILMIGNKALVVDIYQDTIKNDIYLLQQHRNDIYKLLNGYILTRFTYNIELLASTFNNTSNACLRLIGIIKQLSSDLEYGNSDIGRINWLDEDNLDKDQE